MPSNTINTPNEHITSTVLENESTTTDQANRTGANTTENVNTKERIVKNAAQNDEASTSTNAQNDQHKKTTQEKQHQPTDSKLPDKIPNIASTSGGSEKSKDDENFCGKLSNQSSNISIMCRICYDDTLDEPIISPCKCKGTVGMMHKSCLEKWLAESNTNKCDLCFHKFETERTTKYTVNQSVWRWLRYPPASFAFPIRDMRSDMITCMILIPFSILLIYLCLFAAEYYNRQNFSVIPVARWTAISVMFMGTVIVLGFCTWIYLVLRYHSRVWYFWWQRETIVRIHVKAKETR